MSFFETARQFLTLGFTHVIPFGFDHILFILCLFLTGSNTRNLVIMCTVFTVAHSISLGLAATSYISINTKITEPLIALSILVASIQNIVTKKVTHWRLFLVFIFGLIHGLGFAGALNAAGLTGDHFISSLLLFNVGVELGQIAVIIAAYFLIGKWFAKKTWYQEKVVYPLSSIIACIALYWLIERILQ